MLFSFMDFSVNVLKNTFLSDYKTAGGVLSTSVMGDMCSEPRAIAADYSTRIAIKKMHQEYLERYRVGINSLLVGETGCLDENTRETSSIGRPMIGYSKVGEFGRMDTTGTASGRYSEKLRIKAMTELIEKNEAMLIWYSDSGYMVEIDGEISKIIEEVGFSSDEIFIFCSRELCNYHTVSVFLFNKKKIISSGVSIDGNFYSAMRKALIETKLLESAFTSYKASPFDDLEDSEHYKCYNKVKSMSEKKMKYTEHNDEVKKIVLASWIKSMKFVVLNSNVNQEFITIRCFSKELLNTIPTKISVGASLDKEILIKYKIDEEKIENTSECIII